MVKIQNTFWKSTVFTTGIYFLFFNFALFKLVLDTTEEKTLGIPAWGSWQPTPVCECRQAPCCSTSPSPAAHTGWAAPAPALLTLPSCPLTESHRLPVKPQYTSQPNSSLSCVRLQTSPSLGSEVPLLSRCLFPSRSGPKRCWLWVMSAYQLLAPAGLHLAVLQREVLCPWVQKCHVAPHHTSNSLCPGERRRKVWEKEGYFHKFCCWVSKWISVDLLPAHSKESENDSAPMFIHFFPRLSVWGLSGVEFSKAALVHLEADRDIQLISCGLLQAVIRC